MLTQFLKVDVRDFVDIEASERQSDAQSGDKETTDDGMLLRQKRNS
jgi:hypothetical protein